MGRCACPGYGALLEMALVQYAMHRAARKGFHPMLTPDIVQRDVAEGCATRLDRPWPTLGVGR